MAKKNIFHWISTILTRWGALVTGGAFIGVLSIWQGLGHIVNPILYWVIAIAAFVVASFGAWESEYLRAERELERHTRPEIVSEIINCFWDVFRPQGTNDAKTILYLRVLLTNVVDVTTVLSRVEVDVLLNGENLSGTADSKHRDGRISHGIDFNDLFAKGQEQFSSLWKQITSDTPLRKGIPAEGSLAVRVELPIESDRETLQGQVRLRVIDSFKKVHIGEWKVMSIPYGPFSSTIKVSIL